MKDLDVNWRHASYSLDVDYVEVEGAPILSRLIVANDGLFWDGEKFYRIEGKRKYIKRFPDWRLKVRIPYEKVNHDPPDLAQRALKDFL